MLELSNLPSNPGCYLFKDSKDRIIYVGKAKNLKKRVKSYQKKKRFRLENSSNALACKKY